jgi:nucleotide-binding universal stress UspA family protein
MTITYSVGVGLDIAGTLIRIAESGEDVEGTGAFGGCDIVAMATHGRTGLARWIIGSVTDRVLQGTRLPMLIIRPPAMRNHKVTSEEESKDSEPAVWSALF